MQKTTTWKRIEPTGQNATQHRLILSCWAPQTLVPPFDVDLPGSDGEY